jgi:hypothetical protein
MEGRGGKVAEEFRQGNPYAAEAERLLDRAIEKRSEHVLRRAETFANLAVAFEVRQTRPGIRSENLVPGF